MLFFSLVFPYFVVVPIITWQRVSSQRVDKPTFFHDSFAASPPMSWDRVIQDSDEDEPLVEDDIPASIDPLQDHDASVHQLHDHAAIQQDNHRIEYTTTHNASTEPKLSVNFDQFLQSQGASHTGFTSSQQRREERWIPSTSAGGGGSIGASRSNHRS